MVTAMLCLLLGVSISCNAWQYVASVAMADVLERTRKNMHAYRDLNRLWMNDARTSDDTVAAELDRIRREFAK